MCNMLWYNIKTYSKSIVSLATTLSYLTCLPDFNFCSWLKFLNQKYCSKCPLLTLININAKMPRKFDKSLFWSTRNAGSGLVLKPTNQIFL